jgi:hypothetical protein
MQRARDDRRARQPCALKKEQQANCNCGQITENPGARAAARQQEANITVASMAIVNSSGRTRDSTLIGPAPLPPRAGSP